MSPLESSSIPEASEVVLPLNDEEKIRLAQLEDVIQRSLQSFLIVGRCLLEVRNRKLYREHYATWKDYCLRRWALSESRGLELCRATEVVELLTGPGGPGAPDGDSPVPEDLAADALRPLMRLRPDLQIETWRLASRLTERPTQFVIAKIVRTIESAIAQGCDGNGGHPHRTKRHEAEEVVFLRPIFRLSHIAFPDPELFVSHFGDDSEQAARAVAACQELESRCQNIRMALERRFPQLGHRCKQLPKAQIGAHA
jgi:hypothetical protein